MNATETPMTDSAMQGIIDGSSLPAAELVKATKRLCEVAQTNERRALRAEAERDALQTKLDRKWMEDELADCEKALDLVTVDRDKARAQLKVARLYIERMAMPNTTEWLLTTAMQEGRGVLAALDQIGKEANE